MENEKQDDLLSKRGRLALDEIRKMKGLEKRLHANAEVEAEFRNDLPENFKQWFATGEHGPDLSPEVADRYIGHVADADLFPILSTHEALCREAAEIQLELAETLSRIRRILGPVWKKDKTLQRVLTDDCGLNAEEVAEGFQA